jgi:hypothetical protein
MDHIHNHIQERMMLPNFLIIGTQKAATSWLARCLGEHPDVFMVGIKEIHFFNHRFERGLAWYESHFSDWAGQSVIGEATPGYINHPDAPGRIKATLGEEVKLIASLRHPVHRAYSAFWHYVRGGRISANADFRTVFQQSDQVGLRSRGDYFTHLSRYLEYFPRKNLLILIYEEIKRDALKAVSDCLEFLGVDSQFVPSTLNSRVNKGTDPRLFHSQAMALRRTVAAKTDLLPRGLREPFRAVGRHAFEHLILKRLPKQNSYVPLDENLRQELLSEFMPGIIQLEGLLGRDLSIWYGPSRA